MNPRTFFLLAFVTVLGVAAGAFAVSREPGFMTSRGGDVVFPDLNARIDEVAKIELRTPERTMTMNLGDGGWTLAESGDYAVQAKIAKGAVLGFAGLTYVEAKTRQADKYHKLHLQAPEAEGSQGRAVRIYAKNGDTLVDVVLGRVRYNMPGTTRDGVYIRKSDTPQTWLALGQLDISKLPSDWLKQEIVDIKAGRIKSAEIRHPDGEIIYVSKTAATDRNFTMAGIPDGKKLKYDNDPDNIASVLDELELADVRPVEDITFDPKTSIATRIETFDGLIINITMVARKSGAAGQSENWITLRAGAADASPERQKEAEQINAQTSPWAYQLPGYKASRLNKRLSEMLKDQKSAS